MLVLTIQNIKDVAKDSKGNRICDYEAKVKFTDSEGHLNVIAQGEVKSFNRKDGWKELIYEALEEIPGPGEQDMIVGDFYEEISERDDI